jgi:LacI family transcriptional regulator
MAIRHLFDIGRSRILFVGPTAAPGVKDRLAGARMAVEESPHASLEIIDTVDSTVSTGREIGAAIATRAEGALPDGIFCANDLLAIGMLHAFIESRHIRVPEDVALIGYDDIDFAASAIVSLSSIRQPAALIGRTAVELLTHELEDPTARHRQVLFPPELVIRASSRA